MCVRAIPCITNVYYFLCGVNHNILLGIVFTNETPFLESNEFII